VDAKASLAAGTDGVTAQGTDAVYVGSGSGIVGVDKSTLAQSTSMPVSFGRTPIALEVPGGPYYVYLQSGAIVRMGPSAATIHTNAPLADAIGTTDGTVWVHESNSGRLCALTSTAHSVDCRAQVPVGDHGTLSSVGRQPVFVDLANESVRPLTDQGLGPAVPLGAALPPDAEVSANSVGNRLPILEPNSGTLVLADLSGVGSGHPGRPPITVPLGRGDYSAPVASDGAAVVVDRTNGTVLTFDADGKRRADTSLPRTAGNVRVMRGQDGLVYIDDQNGDHTTVVGADGSVSIVTLLGTNPPSDHQPAPRRTPQAPPSATQQQRGQAPVRSSGSPVRVNASAPGAPTLVSAQAGNATVAVSWGAAPDNGAPIMNYRLTWQDAANKVPGGSLTVPGAQLSTVVRNLNNGSTYVFTVSATNRIGTGPGAESPPVTPSSDVPGSPNNVQATAAPDGSVTVTWSAADGEGHQITGYSVTATGSDGSSANVGSAINGTRTTVGSGLTPGVGYTFTVTATNDTGLAGPASSPSNSATPYVPAAAPGTLAAAPSDSQLKLTWSQPGLGGGDLVAYQVSGQGLAPQTVNGNSATFGGLSNGTSYAFTVRAITQEHGRAGGPTASGAAASITAMPGTAPSVTVTGATAVYDRAVVVHVTVDDHNSGTVTCQVILNGAQAWSGNCAGSQDISISGLAYSTNYDVYVQPSNSIGTGPVSDHASFRTNDAPSISVGKGAHGIDNSYCWTAPCAWIVVTMRNFTPNGSVTLWFDTDCANNIPACTGGTNGGATHYKSMTINLDGAGNFSGNTRLFGYSGSNVWVDANGIESNHVTW
jgi:hypothetical protein